MNVITVQGDQPRWDAFVASREDATSHHRYGWKAVLEKSLGHPCHYLAAIDDGGEWRGILPLVHMRSRLFGNYLISLPYLNYGGLLCRDETAAAALLEAADGIRRSGGASYAELRHIARRSDTLPTRQHKVTMILELAASDDGQWKGFDAKLRNQIRKAQKSGLEFRLGGLELLDDFYRVFARNMRDLGSPVYPKQLFRGMLETFPDTSAIAAVLHGGKIIAAGMVCWFRDTVEVPSASSLRDYRAMCPNNLLYWETIRFAIARGFRRFDFGRSTPGEGTYQFKKQWGARPVPLHWQYLLEENDRLPELNADNPKYRLAVRVWQRLPVSLATLLGPRIVRNLP